MERVCKNALPNFIGDEIITDRESKQREDYDESVINAALFVYSWRKTSRISVIPKWSQ